MLFPSLKTTDVLSTLKKKIDVSYLKSCSFMLITHVNGHHLNLLYASHTVGKKTKMITRRSVVQVPLSNQEKISSIMSLNVTLCEHHVFGTPLKKTDQLKVLKILDWRTKTKTLWLNSRNPLKQASCLGRSNLGEASQWATILFT